MFDLPKTDWTWLLERTNRARTNVWTVIVRYLKLARGWFKARSFEEVQHRPGEQLAFNKIESDLVERGWRNLPSKVDCSRPIARTTYDAQSHRMADLGTLPYVIEAILNDLSGHKAGVVGVYNRATYAKEKREALYRWAAHIPAIVEHDKPLSVAANTGPKLQ